MKKMFTFLQLCNGSIALIVSLFSFSNLWSQCPPTGFTMDAGANITICPGASTTLSGSVSNTGPVMYYQNFNGCNVSMANPVYCPSMKFSVKGTSGTQNRQILPVGVNTALECTGTGYASIDLTSNPATGYFTHNTGVNTTYNNVNVEFVYKMYKIVNPNPQADIYLETSADSTTWTIVATFLNETSQTCKTMTANNVNLQKYIRLRVTHDDGYFTFVLDGITLPTNLTYNWSGAGIVSGGTTLTPTVQPTSSPVTYNLNSSISQIGCNMTDPVVVSWTSKSGNLANNNESETCVVKAGQTVQFFNRSSGNYITTITAGASDLDTVTATAYVDVACQMPAACVPSYDQTAVMQRHWKITPKLNNPAQVKLPYTNTEMTTLQTAAAISSSTFDAVSGQGSIKLSKYSNTVTPALVNNNALDNCASGSSTIYANTQTGSTPETGVTGLFSKFSIPSFSEFWLHGSINNSALAVEMSQFTVSCENETKIQWTTNSEYNVSHFELYRSRDGLSWEVISTIDAVGNSTISNEYEFVDYSKIVNMYYKLVSVDFDGTSKVYGPISANCDGKLNTWNLYPVPVSEKAVVTVECTQNSEDVICVFDINGKIVIQQNINLKSGINTFEINTQNLNSGTYIMKLLKNNVQVSPIKMMK